MINVPLRIDHGSPQHWAIRALWLAGTVAFLLYIPTKTETSTIIDMTLAFHLAVAALSLNLVMGYGGIVSLGHSAFFGLGAYTSAVLIDHYGWSQGWTLYISVLLGFVVGCLVSLPALRLSGVYLALVTLGVAVLFPALIKWRKLAWLTDGARGINSIAYKEIPNWPLLPELRKNADDRAVFMYWLAVIVLVVCYLVCRGIVKSRVGRSLIAIRDNQTAAAVMGVNLARTKTLVFGVSAAMCALVGSLFAIGGNLASPDIRNFTLDRQHHVRPRDGARRRGDAVGPDHRCDRVRLPRDAHTRGGRGDRVRASPGSPGRRLAVQLDDRLARLVHPRRRAADHDVRRPVRHRRLAAARHRPRRAHRAGASGRY